MDALGHISHELRRQVDLVASSLSPAGPHVGQVRSDCRPTRYRWLKRKVCSIESKLEFIVQQRLAGERKLRD